MSRWPCRECRNFGFYIQIGGPHHGAVYDECDAPGHHRLLLASYRKEDCRDYTPKEVTKENRETA